jgi:hypothetical protein
VICGIWLVIYVSDPTSIRFDPNQFSLDISSEVVRDFRESSEYRVDVERRLMTFSVLEDFLENPVFGTGYMGTLILTEYKYGRAIPGHGIPSMFAEYGIVGMSIFVWTLVRFWKLTKPIPGRFYTLLVATRVAMAAVLGLGLVYQLVELPNFFIVYGLGTGLGVRAIRERQNRRLPDAPQYQTSDLVRQKAGS